jgi:hypothetical protein
MRTSADLLLASPSIPATHRRTLKRLMIAVLDLALDAAKDVRQAVRIRRKPLTWREDLPWDVGLDHLAEQAFDAGMNHLAKQAFPPWIPRC